LDLPLSVTLLFYIERIEVVNTANISLGKLLPLCDDARIFKVELAKVRAEQAEGFNDS